LPCLVQHQHQLPAILARWEGHLQISWESSIDNILVNILQEVSCCSLTNGLLSERGKYPQQPGLAMSSPSTVGSASFPVSPIALLPGQKHVHLTSACGACRRKEVKYNKKEPCDSEWTSLCLYAT